MSKKFTFKKDAPETGLMHVVQPWELHRIKLDKKEVGVISKEKSGWKVRFAVQKEVTERDPAPFKWVSFKAVFVDANSAREWVNKHAEHFQTTYKLYQFEN